MPEAGFPSREELERMACWFPQTDHVPTPPRTTEFKQLARYRQALWREAHGWPMGSHTPPGGNEVPNGTRVELRFAMNTGANFLSPAIVDQVERRLELREPLDMIGEARLWADLLSSMPMCFNLIGELAADFERAGRAVGTWWPDLDAEVEDIRFEWSPGRGQPDTYLGDRTAFDVAILLRMPSGKRRAIGIETKYHEDISPEPERKNPRYAEVATKAGVFVEGWEAHGLSTKLQQIWRDHLLALSMLQHPGGEWEFARYVLVYPATNPSVAAAVNQYRESLADQSSFEARTLEDLLSHEVLPRPVQTLFKSRYLGGVR